MEYIEIARFDTSKRSQNCFVVFHMQLQAVAPVIRISVGKSSNHSTHTHTHKPVVTGIVKELQMHVKEGPTLHQ
jgi:hypothetical protein